MVDKYMSKKTAEEIEAEFREFKARAEGIVERNEDLERRLRDLKADRDQIADDRAKARKQLAEIERRNAFLEGQLAALKERDRIDRLERMGLDANDLREARRTVHHGDTMINAMGFEEDDNWKYR